MKSMVLLPFLFLSACGQSTNGPNSTPSYGFTTTSPGGSIENYRPANGSDRMRWFLNSTLGPSRLFLAGPINAGWGTLRDVPSEYGTHWDGFGERNGMRLTGVATGKLIEAGLGSAWGTTRATSVRRSWLPAEDAVCGENELSDAASGRPVASGVRALCRGCRKQLFVEPVAR